jgi:hypothetical protein
MLDHGGLQCEIGVKVSEPCNPCCQGRELLERGKGVGTAVPLTPQAKRQSLIPCIRSSSAIAIPVAPSCKIAPIVCSADFDRCNTHYGLCAPEC